jgi:hypothetical protein
MPKPAEEKMKQRRNNKGAHQNKKGQLFQEELNSVER